MVWREERGETRDERGERRERERDYYYYRNTLGAGYPPVVADLIVSMADLRSLERSDSI